MTGLSGVATFRDLRRQPGINTTSFQRSTSDVLWHATHRNNTSAGSVPNEAIIEQIRTAAPTIPIDQSFFKPLGDSDFFAFLTNGLRRTGGKKRIQIKQWDSISPICDGSLPDTPTIPELLRRFQVGNTNGSPSYKYILRSPGLPMQDGTPLVQQLEIFVNNANQKRRSVGASIIHRAQTNAFDEESLDAALYAHGGSKIHPDDLLSILEASSEQFEKDIFTVDNLA